MGPESVPSPGEALVDETMLVPGQRLGRYQLIKRLAIGGMAEIFLARVVGLEGFEKRVVLKSILAQHATDEEWVQMFLEEARLAATLQHPNIAQVFDVGRDRNVHFFTMEYVRGADVRRIMKAAERRGGVPLEVAVAIVIGAAAGLHYAHDKTDDAGRPLGIVHRDVSPANVLVSEDGAVKVVDFGIAKAALRRAATRTGTIKGKAGWISPEQCRGDRLDRRSDIFALGILLYELTTGVSPFRGDNEYAILRQVVEQDAAPPSKVRPGYPPGLDAIVVRCLRRDRDERYETAQELQIDLETFAREQSLTISSVELARFMEELFGRGGFDLEMSRADGTPISTTRPPLIMRPPVRGRARLAWTMAAGALVGLGGAYVVVRERAPARGAEPAVVSPVAPVAVSPPPPAPAPPPPEPAPAIVEARPAPEPPPPPPRRTVAKRKHARPAPPRPATANPPRSGHPDPDAPFPR